MSNKKSFFVTMEQTVEVELDMSKYTDEMIEQIKDYWGVDYLEEKDEVLKFAAESAAHQFINGQKTSELEGLPISGQKCKHISCDFIIVEA